MLKPFEKEYFSVLTSRYLYLKKVIAEAGGTKTQRKEFDALKWALKQLREQDTE